MRLTKLIATSLTLTSIPKRQVDVVFEVMQNIVDAFAGVYSGEQAFLSCPKLDGYVLRASAVDWHRFAQDFESLVSVGARTETVL